MREYKREMWGRGRVQWLGRTRRACSGLSSGLGSGFFLIFALTIDLDCKIQKIRI